MAKRHDEPTSFKEKLQQTIPGASSSEMKDALAKMVSQKTKHTCKDMPERFHAEQPCQREQDPPAAAAEPSTPEPSMPEPSTSEPPSSEASPPEKSPPRASAPEASTTSSPAPAPSKASRPRRGRQIDRTKRALRKLFPPEGKIPAEMEVETARGRVAAELAEESRGLGLADPSWDVVNAAIKELGRAPA